MVAVKHTETICLCLNPARVNQALIEQVHKMSTLSDIQTCNMTITDASSGYHDLKRDKISSYETIFVCHFGRYSLTRLSFGVTPASDIFQKKIEEIFKGLPNVFGIADNILIVGYDAEGRDHNTTLREMM